MEIPSGQQWFDGAHHERLTSVDITVQMHGGTLAPAHPEPVEGPPRVSQPLGIVILRRQPKNLIANQLTLPEINETLCFTQGDSHGRVRLIVM